MVNVSLKMKDLSNEISVAKRSSPRLLGKNTEPVDMKSLPDKEKTVSRKRQKPSAESIKANGVEEKNGNPTQIVTDTNAHNLVMQTVRKFNKHYLHFVQVEEQRVQGICEKSSKIEKSKSGCNSSKKSKVAQQEEQNKKHGSKRPDLKALSKMIEDQTILYPVKRIGHLPGVDVGHHFYSRAEMAAVGLHSHWLNGIDYMGSIYSKMEEYRKYSFPLAVCIVLSGMYEDDQDNSEDIIYTGQGGHDLLGNKRQIKNQMMERGNLALKNSMLNDLPVRVVRGHESTSSYCGKVYTYDGLYKVHKYWAEKGLSGFTVFKYQLKRLDGQPILTTNQVAFIRGKSMASFSSITGLVCEDIAEGVENFPIPATNLVDDACFPPEGYSYCKDTQLAEELKLPSYSDGCKCKDDCTNPRVCACARLNGSEFPYVRRNGGRLIEAKAVVFECGPNCGCPPSCGNRVSQQGLKYRLEVFRTPNKGWGVRSWDTIPSGAFVCDYTGILRRTEDVENVLENNFIFEIDCLQTMKGLDGREKRLGDVSLMLDVNEKKLENPEFCIDAGSIGNVTRFINHSCEPNLFVQCILSSHRDIRLARIVLFAADTIPPLQELSYDYGYALDSVVGPDGKIQQMECHCGAAECKGRLY